jgi:nuclear migration protein JNM1
VRWPLPFDERENTHQNPQTATIRTSSPSPSDEDGRHDPDAGLDRQHIDRTGARRRFERSAVDAEDVDFSDTLSSNRKSYKTYETEHESLSKKLARLKREAEEIKLELEKRKEGSLPNIEDQEDDGNVEDGVVKLSEMLDSLYTNSRSTNRTTFIAEAAGSRQLPKATPLRADVGGARALDKSGNTPEEASQTSTTTAVAAFADRLSSLESALGLASTPSTSDITSILPTLTSLSTQITTLSTTLASPSLQTSSSGGPSSGWNQTSGSISHLDALATRLRSLTSESDKLAISRKRALESLHDLQEARMRLPTTFPPTHTNQDTHRDPAESVLEDSSAKIAALYATLPTIQDLQPLLPVVLERLRSLQFLHADAAGAKGELEEVEKQQAATAQEIERWRKGLEGVEAKMVEYQKVMGKNTEVIEKMVEDVEERLARLETQ